MADQLIAAARDNIKSLHEELASLSNDVDNLDTLLELTREALADAILRPAGIIPPSAEGLINGEEIEKAQKRRDESNEIEVGV